MEELQYVAERGQRGIRLLEGKGVLEVFEQIAEARVRLRPDVMETRVRL